MALDFVGKSVFTLRSRRETAFSPQTPGKWLWINNDDTDGDGLPDNANQIIDSIDDLDDVPELWIRAIDPDLVPPGGTLHLETTDPNVVRVFDGRFAFSVEALGPQTGSTHQIDPIPTSGDVQYGIEGVAPGTAELSLVLKDGGAVVCQDTVQVTVVGLEIAWETTANQPITDSNGHPDAGIGVQYFPGATTPGGGWNDSIQVRIATDPPVDGLNIYLKAFDPDDPSAKDNVVDNDLDGGDNRDATHGDTNELSATQTSTDATGEAVVQFRTAHQPGDNHRIAATLKQSALDILTDNNVPPSDTDPGTEDQVELFTGHISPLLTVWRKLHVEVDIMARPVFYQNTNLEMWSNPRADPADPYYTIDIIDPPDGDNADNRFAGGYATLSANGFPDLTGLLIDASDKQIGLDTLTVQLSGGFGGRTSGTYVISDDDIDQPTFLGGLWGSSLGGATNALSPPSDMNIVAAKYAVAYILSIVEDAHTSAPGPTFILNQKFGDTALFGKSFWYAFLAHRTLPVSEPEYWTVEVCVGFQAEQNRDADPNSEGTTGDGCYLGVSTHPEDSTQAHAVLGENYIGMAAIMQETIRDASDLPEWVTTAHEIGHTLGLPHIHAGGIMESGKPNEPRGQDFSPEALDQLRHYVEP